MAFAPTSSPPRDYPLDATPNDPTRHGREAGPCVSLGRDLYVCLTHTRDGLARFWVWDSRFCIDDEREPVLCVVAKFDSYEAFVAAPRFSYLFDQEPIDANH